MNFIDLHKNDLISACDKYHVNKLYAFGSVIGDQFNKDSDVDLLVDFENIPVSDYFDNYFRLKDELEKIFNKPIDLVEANSLKNPYFIESIEKSKHLIYG